MKTPKLIFIWTCNLIDTIATLYLYQTGMFKELNPFMALLLQNPFLFGVVKVSIISIVLVRLWQAQEDEKAQIAINVGCWIYGLIALYYVIQLIIFYVIQR